MPARNIIKEYAEDSYYHVYNRGVNKQVIFHDEQDYTVFLGLLKRYLGDDQEKRYNRTVYPSYSDQVELLAYCLMPNHFHLLLYQIDKDGMKLLIKSVSVAYVMYFNKKYHRVGTLFQQRYRAVRIDEDSQLMHTSRYIHLNPKDYLTWEWSSINYYRGLAQADWVHTSKVLGQHSSREKFLEFLDDYVDRRDELKTAGNNLAG